jgi:hypothetical protein
VRELLLAESVEDGLCRKIKAWLDVTRAIARFGWSRRRIRIDMIVEEQRISHSYDVSAISLYVITAVLIFIDAEFQS